MFKKVISERLSESFICNLDRSWSKVLWPPLGLDGAGGLEQRRGGERTGWSGGKSRAVSQGLCSCPTLCGSPGLGRRPCGPVGGKALDICFQFPDCLTKCHSCPRKWVWSFADTPCPGWQNSLCCVSKGCSLIDLGFLLHPNLLLLRKIGRVYIRLKGKSCLDNAENRRWRRQRWKRKKN